MSRNDIAMPALPPDLVRVEPQDDAERLRALFEVSRAVRFFDRGDRASGTWADFLWKDHDVRLALIATTRDGSRRQNPPALQTDSSPEEVRRDALFLMDETLGRLEQANRWHFIESGVDDPRDFAFQKVIATAISESLSSDLNTVRQFALAFRHELDDERPMERLLAAVESFDASLWKLNRPAFPIASRLDRASDLFPLILADSNAKTTCGEIRDEARRRFEARCDTSVRRSPQMTLIEGFLRALTMSASAINRYPRRHLAYYFGDVLGTAPRKTEPDRAIVCLRSTHGSESVLPAGTLLDAGKDDAGLPITFRTIHAQELLGTTITSIETLYLSGGKAIRRTISPEHQGPWPAFGSPTVPAGAKDASLELGFAIASPLFELSSGVRTITLTFPEATQKQWDQMAAHIELSCGAAWVAPDKVTASATASGSMQIVLTLDASFPPPAAPESKSPEIPPSRYPVIRFILKAPGLELIDEIRKRLVENPPTLEVSAATAPTKAANSQAPLTTARPFAVFGHAAIPGSYFELSASEALRKPLTSLRMSLKWHSLPQSIADYFRGYVEASGTNWVVTDSSFLVQFALLSAKGWNDVSASSLPLASTLSKEEASSTTPTPPGVALFPGGDGAQFDFDVSGLEPEPELSLTAPSLRMTLASPPEGFGAPLYENSLARSLLENARKAFPGQGQERSLFGRLKSAIERREVNVDGGLVKSVRKTAKDEHGALVDALESLEGKVFSSKKKLATALKSASGGGSTIDKIFHDFIEFIYQVIEDITHVTPGVPDYQALPQPPYVLEGADLELTYTATGSPDGAPPYPQELWLIAPDNVERVVPEVAALDLKPAGILKLADIGTLTVTFSATLLPSHLSLLVYLADEDRTIPPLNPTWRLVGHEGLLQPLDGTDGFRRSGIIQFTLPSISVTESTTFDGTFSLECRVENPECAPRMNSLIPDALLAERVTSPQAVSMTPLPLPAKRITKLVKSVRGVASVTQPFASRGGEIRETEDQWFARTSGRLRTQGRAVSARDFEMLALQTTREVFFARAFRGQPEQSANDVAGALSVMVLPRVEEGQATSPTPFVSPATRRDLATRLSQRSSHFATVSVVSPVIVPVLVRAAITLDDGAAAATVATTVQDALHRLLSPWLYDQPHATGPVSSVTANEAQAALERCVGVARVTEVELVDVDASPPKGPTSAISVDTPWTILGSARTHDLTLIEVTGELERDE